MAEKHTHSPESPDSHPSVLAKIFKTISTMRDYLEEVITMDIPKRNALHPDFRIRWVIDKDLTWFCNKHWGMMPEPEFKIGFYFDDPSDLDECKWVGKFGRNLNPKIPEKYFFVGYGDPRKYDDDYDLAAMKEWAMKFAHPSLMKYDGELVRMLDESDKS